MNKLIKYKEFFYDGNQQCSGENFQHYLFKDINLEKEKKPISFFRCDFRGTKFENSFFSNNNFQRADFIDINFNHGAFKSCNFKSGEFHNSYFEEVFFKKNNYEVTIDRCYFEGCKFSNENIKLSDIKNSVFTNCLFKNCFFSHSSLGEIEFNNCSFTNVDLAENYAVNLSFINCKFSDVILDADYLGSYLFKNQYPQNLSYKYKGKILNIEVNQLPVLEGLIKQFYESHRLYELFNILIIYNYFSNKKTPISTLFQTIVSQILSEKYLFRREYSLSKIFKILEFYFNTNFISLKDYFKIIFFLDKLNTNQLSFKEKLQYASNVSLLKNFYEQAYFDVEIINNEKKFLLFTEISVEEDDISIANKIIKNLMTTTLNFFSNIPSDLSYYKIIGTRTGSITFQIISISVIIMSLLKLMKTFSKTTSEIIIDYHYTMKVIDMTRESTSIEELEKIQKLHFDYCKNNNKSDTELVSIIGKIKKLKIYPNAFGDSTD